MTARRNRVRIVGGVLLVAGLVALAGCSGGSQPKDPGPSPTPTHTTPSPTSTIDPRAQAAVAAYENFFRASDAAFMNPPQIGHALSAEQDFTRYSFDPVRGQYGSYAMNLAFKGYVWRGTPPQPRVSVTGVDLAAKPYPKVTLVDCPTVSPTWNEYVAKTSQQFLSSPNKVPPPYPITVEVILYKGHWGVTKSTPRNTTCTPA
jgi:hypothetical protein